GSPTSPTTTVTNLSEGINRFEWSVSNSPCNTNRDTVDIEVLTMPSASNAGLDQTVCLNTVLLMGNEPQLGIGTWTLQYGSGVITDQHSPSTVVNGLSNGLNTFVWSISNGCGSRTDTVHITYSGSISASQAGIDQHICSTTTTVWANTPEIGTGQWRRVSGSGNIANTSSPQTTINNLGVGINQFVWEISNPPCTSSIDTINIEVYEPPSQSSAGLDQLVCSSTASLMGNVPNVGNGQWTLVSGGGNIVSSSSATSEVNNLIEGENIFIWTISNGNCPVSKDTVRIIRQSLPSLANAGMNQQICATSVTIEGNIPQVGSGMWRTLQGTGILGSPTSPTTTVTNLSEGINRFEWSVSNSPCNTNRDTVDIEVLTMPSASNAGLDQTVCLNTVLLMGNVPQIGIGTWTLQYGSGVITDQHSPSTVVNGLSNGLNTFVWSISNGCGSRTDTVHITKIAEATLADAGENMLICSNSTTLQGNTPLVGTGLWTLISGNCTIENPEDPQTIITNIQSGQNILRWTISNMNCPANYDEVIITYSCPNAIITQEIPNSPFCENTSYNITIPFSYSGSFVGSFIAQLSDKNGDFTNPIVIGTGITTPIYGVIPSNTPFGFGYQVRIINENPMTIGDPGNSYIWINTCKEISTSDINYGPYCSNTTYDVEVNFTTIGNLTGPFIAQLSDTLGNFTTNPTTIGYAYSNPIYAHIPGGSPSSKKYRIRVISRVDGVDGIPNNQDIYINTCLTSIDNILKSKFKLFPNPNTGVFTIVADIADFYTLNLYNSLGQEVFFEKRWFDSKLINPINVNNMPQGVYLLTITNDKGERYIQTIVIE
ncbi:MAG: T9SS type A sorting domain-containing protein, partial [Chitinophagales bacterium]|nr:T9SS type A sorting domain-containing protein [Chitinophagales bacterium]